MNENKPDMGKSNENNGHDMWCNHGHYHRHFVLRWILGLIILAGVFCLGVKVGEFKEVLNQAGFGYHDRYDRMDRMHNQMFFRTFDTQVAPTLQTPATPGTFGTPTTAPKK